MSHSVTVTTGARLHFGLIVAAADAGPTFGSVGAMVDEPGFTVRVEPSPSADHIAAPHPVAQRVAGFLATYRQQRMAPPVRIDVSRTIPEHAGLGSGTQLGLAVATALTRLFDAEPIPPRRLAQMLGRGRRSSIGVFGFEHGGCIFSRGWVSGNEHVAMPDQWRIVLVTPEDRQGLSGGDELQAFGQMTPMSGELCERLQRLLSDCWLPALRDGDFPGFSNALYEFGVTVGRYFAPYQGGAFALPEMAALVEHLRQRGVAGVAQSSWGPTIAALCVDESSARELQSHIARDPRWRECAVRCVAPLNRGATVISS
jgi:predicted sugar kinase